MKAPGPQELWRTNIGSLYRVLLIDGAQVVTLVELNANTYWDEDYPAGSVRRFSLENWHDFFEYATEWNREMVST